MKENEIRVGTKAFTKEPLHMYSYGSVVAKAGKFIEVVDIERNVSKNTNYTYSIIFIKLMGENVISPVSERQFKQKTIYL